MVFSLFLVQKAFFAISLSPIILKPLLTNSAVNNTSREVYLRSLTYRAEKALYYSVENALVIYNLMFVVISINVRLVLGLVGGIRKERKRPQMFVP